MNRVGVFVYNLNVMGGAEKVSVDVANSLAENYKTTLISLHGKEERIIFGVDKRVEVVWLNLDEDRLFVQWIKARKKIRNLLWKHKIDVALLEGGYTGFVVSGACPYRQTKFVFCDHGALLSEIQKRKVTYMRKIAAKRTDITVTLTQRSKESYKDVLRIKDEKLRCIYNWINEKDREDGANHSYQADSRNIISIGRFGAEKGYDLLVKVASLVMPNYPNWMWHIYGDGETFEETKNEIKAQGLEGQVILHGACRDVSEAYLNAAMLVLPSYREGMPLVLLEALAYKLPCVSFDILTGPSEIIRDGETGFLVPPYDIEKMAERIEQLINDKQMRCEMSQATIYQVDAFKKEKIIAQWEDLIEELASDA